MKPRTSTRSVPKTKPDKKSSAGPHADIPAWAEKALNRVVTGNQARSAETTSEKSPPQAVFCTSWNETELDGGILDQSSVRCSKSVPTSCKRQSQSPCPKQPVISAKTFQGVSNPFLNIIETAQLLGVSQKTIRRLIDRGELNAVRVGRSVRIRPEVLAAYIDWRTA